MKKKILTFILITSLVLCSAVFADGTKIKDIDSGSSYAKSSILYLANQNVVKGDAKGNFSPRNPITRAELVALIVRALKIDISNIPVTGTFTDVPVNNWAFSYIEAAFKEGIITGVNATEFKPNAKITREEMAVILVRSLKLLKYDHEIEINNLNSLQDKSDISSWAQAGVELAIETGLMKGVSAQSFEPKAIANREQTAVVVRRLMLDQKQLIEAFGNQETEQGEPKLFVNNEEIELINKPIIKDGIYYVPVEFVNMLPINHNHYYLKEEDPIVSFAIAEAFKQPGIDSVWMQVGKKLAYKNLGGDPLLVPQVPVESHLPMEAAPILHGQKVYLPAEEFFKIFGIDFQYDRANNKGVINDDRLSQLELHHALTNIIYNGYIGMTKSKSIMKTFYDETDQNLITYTQVGWQNSIHTLESNGKRVIETSRTGTKTQEEAIKIIQDRYYEKDPSDGKWISKKIIKERFDLYSIYYDPIFHDFIANSFDMNKAFYDNFNRIDAEYEGIVYMSGIRAKKYVMHFDQDTIKNTMSEKDYEIVKAYVKKALHGKINYKYEFYVSKGSLIKQTFQVTGVYLDPGTHRDYDYLGQTTIFYKDIGKYFEINAPKTLK